MSDEIGVFGLGRFGSLWARELSARWPVVGADPVETPEGIESASPEEVAGCRDVFVCTPISRLEEALAPLAGIFQAGTTVLDTCSVKVEPARVMNEILPGHVEIVGTHPMFGPDSVDGGISGRSIAMCPVRAREETVRRWSERFEEMGLRVVMMSPDEHDREAARTQGITHLVGRMLGRLELEESPLGTVGYGSLRKIVEQTCRDSEQLFLDMQRLNPHARRVGGRVREALEEVLAMISEDELN